MIAAIILGLLILAALFVLSLCLIASKPTPQPPCDPAPGKPYIEQQLPGDWETITTDRRPQAQREVLFPDN